MHVLAFGASNHSASINGALARFTADRFKEKFRSDAVIEFLDINDYEMPIYSIDREKADGIPQRAKDFFAKIGGADALIISYAEYNGSYSSAWKNIYDWMSRIDAKVYQDKPVVALAATPGPRAGAGVLGAVEATAPFFGIDLKGVVGVGVWGEAVDPETGALTRQASIEEIDGALKTLAQAT